jgi:hypothetical protein
MEKILYDMCLAVLLIETEDEKDLLMQILFEKTEEHKVVFLPYDLSWNVKPEFEGVCDALIKMSSIILLVNKYEAKFKDPRSKGILMDIRCLYNLLKEGLRELGCRTPPFLKGTDLDPSDVMFTAQEINANFVRRT